jgi:hypothetical protein
VLYQGSGAGSTIVSPYDWVLTDASGTTYGPVDDGAAGAVPQRELPANASVRGRLGFAVPQAARGLVLHFDAERGDESARVPLT